MKFEVTRISKWDGKPCKEAKEMKATYIDRRTVKTLKEAEKLGWYKDWYENGVNHREEGDCIACDVKEKRDIYIIEINDLKELLKFVCKYGDIVIEGSNYKEVTFKIEIYDGYRE